MVMRNKHLQKKPQQNRKPEELQTVEQLFFNDAYFQTLSLIEVIHHRYIYTHQQNIQRQFEMYDLTNYSKTGIEELKEQLRLRLIIFKNTRQMFYDEEQGRDLYQLPKNSNEVRLIEIVTKYQKIFAKVGDLDCYRMCEDWKTLVKEGGYGEFHFQSMKFNAKQKIK